jgi:DNA repair exonuclease SbcCD ATPase subunit
MEAGTVRLKDVSITGFRGFGGELTVDMNADVILLHGPNGSGKTSLFDSILWALTGAIERNRIGSDVVSKYAEFGEARVVVSFARPDGQTLEVTRRQFAGANQSSLSLLIGAERYTGPVAEARLIESLWVDGTSSPDPRSSLSRSITRAVYLQQDQVRSFIEDEDANSRFEIVSEIVGAGRVAELVRQLETGRKAWTTATNRERDSQLEPLVKRRDTLRMQLERSASALGATDDNSEQRWTAWWERVADVLPPGSSTSSTRSGDLNGALGELRSLLQQVDAQRAAITELRALASGLPPEVGGLAEAQAALERAAAQVEAREADLRVANAEAAAARAEAERTTEESAALATLARLARDRLDDGCPVCGQTHTKSDTVARLDRLIANAQTRESAPLSRVPEAVDALRLAETERATAESEVSRLGRAQRLREAALAAVARSAEALAIGGTPAEMIKICDDRLSQLTVRAQSASELRRAGESLASASARAAERERATELTDQLQVLDAEIEAIAARLAVRDDAGRIAAQMHSALTALSENLVESELRSIEPTLQRIYASVDPHPSFRAVRFLTDTVRKRGTLQAVVEDDESGHTKVDPAVVLSSSQLNVLAVVTFLAMNLSATALPLDVAALDDPLQSLDNINLLGLADLLRRSRRHRQLIISTHDDRLAGLLERKLRPVGNGQRTLVIRLDAWEPAGPTVVVRDIPADSPAPRLRVAG